jgi:hypothetical protein
MPIICYLLFGISHNPRWGQQPRCGTGGKRRPMTHNQEESENDSSTENTVHDLLDHFVNSNSSPSLREMD